MTRLLVRREKSLDFRKSLSIVVYSGYLTMLT